MFNQLVKYVAKHGHTNVPQKSGKLGKWVDNQRTGLGKKRKMTQKSNTVKTNQRINELDSLGFKW